MAHAHDHPHHHHHPGSIHPPAPVPASLLRSSLGFRLLLAAGVSALLWAFALWAMG
jgi:hypothetical protein